MRRPITTGLVPALALSFFLLALPLLAADGPAAKVSDLSWMTGHWEGSMGNGGTLEENWTEPKGGSIAAMVRGTGAGATNMIEMIVIEEENGSLTLRLQQWNPGFVPRSEKPQSFKLVESVPNKVRWEATSEGGLQKLGYTRDGDTFTISVTTAGGSFDIPLKARSH